MLDVATDVVEAGDGAADPGVVLQAALHAPVDGAALYLRDLHLERSLEVAGGDEGEGGGRVAGARVYVDVVPGVAPAHDRDRGAARHHEPATLRTLDTPWPTSHNYIISCKTLVIYLHWSQFGSVRR